MSDVMTPLLEAQGVSKQFGGGLLSGNGTLALDYFSLALNAAPATITTLAGESGSGKSTAVNLLLGLLSPSNGRVLFKGDDIQRMNPAQWQTYRREVQAVFQDPYEVFNPVYRVDRVLRAAIRKFRLARDADHMQQMMAEALEVVGMRPADIFGKFPHQLSGGQRQRIMIARAFLLKPRLIVADEPVSMLDASLRGLILEIMLRMKHDYGISFIYVTHDLSTAYQISDRLLVLYRGKVVESGGVDAVIKRPHHPYTQLLTAAVTIPDPSKRWGQTVATLVEDAPHGKAEHCGFANRCPHVKPICRQRVPPPITIEAGHEAACFLYGGDANG